MVLDGLKKHGTDKIFCLPMELGKVRAGLLRSPDPPALLLVPVLTLTGLHSLVTFTRVLVVHLID